MKINILNKIIIMVAVILLVGCAVHQPVSAPTAAASVDTVTFSGKIITDGGRSAGVDIDINKLDLSVTATYDTETKNGVVDDNKTTWSITLPKNDAKWKIEIEAKLNNTIIYYGTTDVSADGTISGDCNITVYFKSDLLRGTSGSISLPFTDASGKISKVIMKTVSDNPDDPTVIDASADFDSTTHTAILNATIPTGQNTKTFDFCDSAGNVLYQCREIITVFSDCTTDTWFGASSHIQKNDADKFEFKITSDLIDHYGTEIVPRTGIVLYDNTYDNGENVLQYTFKNKKVNSTVGASSFCFDNEGNIYVMKDFSKTSAGTIIWSNKEDFGNNGELLISNLTLENITIDLKNNTFYGVESNQGSYYLYAFPDLTNGNTDGRLDYQITSDFCDGIPAVLTVYDKELFIPYCMEDALYVMQKSLNDAQYDEDTESYSLDLGDEYNNIMPNISLQITPEITDVIYQDGCIYMLLREQKYYWDNFDQNIYSRGAVIKYDILTKTSDAVGWTEDEISSDDIIKMSVCDNNGNKVYTDTDSSNPFILNGNETFGDDEIAWNTLFPTIHSYREGEIDSEDLIFYGPQKFIAIRPRKLVIADDGLAFYLDDEEVFYKNVNRIVTVDLESFVIDSTSDTIVSFNVETPNIHGEDISAKCTSTVYVGSEEVLSYYLAITNAD